VGIERLFASNLDGAIGVSPRDSTLLRWIGGIRNTMTIRNGVDLNYFRPDRPTPCGSEKHPRSLVFWGRMDFEPNADAVLWFSERVWPILRAKFPDAIWHIVGKNPTEHVQRLANRPGITVLGAVDDIRTHAAAASITILPIRCGAGIKNKLLEAAAMARPILASPKAVLGLNINNTDPKPMIVCPAAENWLQEIERLWADPQLRNALGLRALDWVRTHHNWTRAAQSLVEWLAEPTHRHTDESWQNPTTGSTAPRPAVVTIPAPTNQPLKEAA
jgi:glycosyltransferase involved in cell wall biosynthesis